MNLNDFIKELKKINIEITDIQLKQLNKYYELLVEYNKVMNLTGITEKDQVYLKHFYDSLTLTKVIDPTKEEKGLKELKTIFRLAEKMREDAGLCDILALHRSSLRRTPRPRLLLLLGHRVLLLSDSGPASGWADHASRNACLDYTSSPCSPRPRDGSPCPRSTQ